MAILYNINLNLNVENSEFIKKTKLQAQKIFLRHYQKNHDIVISKEVSYGYRPQSQDAQADFMELTFQDAQQEDASIFLFSGLQDVCIDLYKAVRLLDYWIDRAEKANHHMSVCLYGYRSDTDYLSYRKSIYDFFKFKYPNMEKMRKTKPPYPAEVMNVCISLRMLDNPPRFDEIGKHALISSDAIHSYMHTNNIYLDEKKYGRPITDAEINLIRDAIARYRKRIYNGIELSYD